MSIDNTFIGMGRLTKDPELSVLNGQQGNQTSALRSTIAISRGKVKEGQEDTDFLNIKAYGKTADFIGKYFAKGNRIRVQGEIRIDKYTDKNNQKQTAVYLLVNEAGFVDTKANNGGVVPQVQQQPQYQPQTQPQQQYQQAPVQQQYQAPPQPQPQYQPQPQQYNQAPPQVQTQAPQQVQQQAQPQQQAAPVQSPYPSLGDDFILGPDDLGM